MLSSHRRANICLHGRCVNKQEEGEEAFGPTGLELLSLRPYNGSVFFIEALVVRSCLLVDIWVLNVEGLAGNNDNDNGNLVGSCF